MYEYISSPQNQKIKLIKELYNPKGRKKHKLFIAEGTKEIAKALEAGYYPLYVFINKSFIEKHESNFFSRYKLLTNIIYEVEYNLFRKISYREDTEGIIAIFKTKEIKLNEIILNDNAFVVILENIEKPGNLGAVLRTADATQIDAVIVSEINFDIYNPNVIRASLGCVFTTNIVVAKNNEILKWLKENNFNIYVATPHAKTVYYDIQYEGKIAVVFGSENKGVSEFWKEESNYMIKIPMKGLADSLNLSNSVAIILYEYIRQKEKREFKS
ncbi:MAG: RNA methyltransferase [Bacteroidales bacterium]|nr:RNA methyltransferase [Bacteroidales bacterium]